MFTSAHTQVVVQGEDALADSLYASAVAPFALNKAVLRFRSDQVVPQMLPPALGATLPNLPGTSNGHSMAVLCSGFACQPPIENADALARALKQALRSS